MAAPLLEAVRAGATLDGACRTLGVNVRTARDWAHRGRKAPEGRYGAFARDLDAVRDGRRLPAPAARRTLTREEWDGCLAEAVRAGSVQAMKLWVETRGGEGSPADEFAEFDP